MSPKATSPASSGPAGSLFEAQVGASYLLAMLVGGEPRGLPGTTITSVELQRAGEGFPLDDVIVHAHDAAGKAMVIEIQVKRSISFAPTDVVFRSVVAQIVETAKKSDFWESQNELAVATARTSRKIDGAYQDVLTWARQIGTSKVFSERIRRQGQASDEMRSFVKTFKSHLEELKFAHDDETVWKLLRRFQILVFDYTAVGSAAESLARERSARALEPSQANRGGDLWEALVALALKIAASGGDRSRETIRHDADLKTFTWVGEPHHRLALAALAENSAAALADIRDQIDGVSINRPARVGEVRAHLDLGRYVEIRGDAGVGKSAILKHFANQAQIETRVLVMKPGRTIPRGWTTLRDTLRFEGSARELLLTLSSDGHGLLFIDNLDLFSTEEQATVNDLVRTAATIPGFSVIATARRNFGVDDINWLPQESLEQLGRAPTIYVNELDDAEVIEMAAAVPAIARLLASSHPARDVTRNLFRLARLADRSSGAPLLQTENDMADEWWDTADGPSQDRRERQRVLRHLAEQALQATAVFDVSSENSDAVDALVATETLREFGDDRVGFRHDVLREWALARFIRSDITSLGRLPLDEPAPAYLARSVELYARSLIESADDDLAWSSLLATLSQPRVHGTWRRAVLLALVHSEVSRRVLKTAQTSLLADSGALLNELIRTTVAVHAQAAREAYAGSGLDVGILPGSLVVPVGPFWSRLIEWILSIGDALPGGSLPDVVDLFNRWSTSMLGYDPVTPRLLDRFYDWLCTIEDAKDEKSYRRSISLFGNALSSRQIDSLEGELRRGFAMCAHRNPKLAAEYLNAVKQRQEHEHIVQELQEFRGTLASAAPEALADLFEATLIPNQSSEQHHRLVPRLSGSFVFTDFDSHYLPVSPAQGPFFDLLKANSNVGQRLIRRLLDHAIATHFREQTDKTAFIDIDLPSGLRRFTWPDTFLWSRELHSTFYAVTSGLMALEAWAHTRVEAGETVEAVITSIFGEGDTPSAYLLIAIDLILSHWPSSREVAVPFVANPSLIILDRDRQLADRFEIPDILGLKGIQREPIGPVNAKSLSERASRGTTLYDLLKFYTFDTDAARRDRLVLLLQKAMDELPTPGPDANFSNPEFMVRHALNQLDPANWSPANYELQDGRTVTAQKYVPPKSETDHLAPFQSDATQRSTDAQMQQASAELLEGSSTADLKAVNVMVDWAMAKPMGEPVEENERRADSSAWLLRQAILNIAVIAMRDGDEQVLRKSREWAHGIFSDNLAQPIDRRGGPNEKLQYNSLALSFAGLAFSIRDRADERVVQRLLEISSHESPAGWPGFQASSFAIAKSDARLLKSTLRCALRACIRCRRNQESSESEYTAQKVRLRHKVESGVMSELDWLAGRSTEPEWPELPMRDSAQSLGVEAERRPQGGVRKPRTRQDFYIDTQGAAAWLSALSSIAYKFQYQWLRDVISHYRDWTINANGSSLTEELEFSDSPNEWNDSYVRLMAACLSDLSISEVDAFATSFIISLPPKVFLRVGATFLRSLDIAYLDFDAIDPLVAKHVRESLARALRSHINWNHFVSNRSASVETNMGNLVSALFFHTYHHGFTPPKCYLAPSLVEKTDILLPTIQSLASEAPTILVATEIMTLFKVAPHTEQLPFILEVGKSWVKTRPDDPTFWVDYGVGGKLCQLLEGMYEADRTAFEVGSKGRNTVDLILSILVRTGVPEAGHLEVKLSKDLS